MKRSQLIAAVGKPRGHFKLKENRAAKLISMWNDLEYKFEQMIERGQGRSLTARLAYATLLMMETGIRIGNEKSSEGWVCENQIVCRKDNKEKGLKVGDIIWQHPMFGQHVSTYGLTTLKKLHVKKGKKNIKLSFVGKKLVDQELIAVNRMLYNFCAAVSDGRKRDETFLNVSYHDLKKFIKKYVGKGFMPKDLRTAKVNLIFTRLFVNQYSKEFLTCTSKSARNKVLGAAIEETANKIGHTKSVCRSSYLSPQLLNWIQSHEIKK